eukprot:CAMPEP_0184738272 /NCGR_PEP_ID=MMETSP0315-20130426/967_1 /TAXON_ID=101924 /ORGANISM="Rhodosorus marinus, Strain UTEX LB 2760" /LENGTH=384 /DNA_ID=CAMNT_0027205917 /DNA_START=55 /DNA_END=1209 /DNA_ORIENTATION=-
METASQQYIDERVQSAPDEGQKMELAKLSELYQKRLWHQMTMELRRITKDETVAEMLPLYPNFVQEFEGKLNPVELIGWAVDVSRGFCSTPTGALEFLTPFLDEAQMAMRSTPAKILLLSEIAGLKLTLNVHEESKMAITTARELVEGQLELPGHIHSAFYRSAAEFHKIVGSAAEFYRNALQFLSYTKPESLSKEEQLQWAFDLGNAALVGEDIYNFGELLAHGVISALEGTEHQWLLDLLRAFDRGELTKFEEICSAANDKMIQQPVLVAHRELIRQKITILALMELAFTRTAGRTITFAEISETCRLPESEVEFLLMRALSLKLISGTIDGVDRCITITRVQPRVLGRDPIRLMAERLDEWSAEVNETLLLVQSKTTELNS